MCPDLKNRGHGATVGDQRESSMASTLKSLRALSAPSRVRLVALLNESELTVRELTEITGMRQSGVSMHLGQMQEAGLVASSRDGKNAYYRIARDNGADSSKLVELAAAGAVEIPEHASDLVNLKRILERRENQDLVYFNRVAGRFDSVYGPGRSWQAFGQLLLRLVPEIVVADLGSGEGLLSELLARKCKRVIAVDNSAEIVKARPRRGETAWPISSFGRATCSIRRSTTRRWTSQFSVRRCITPRNRRKLSRARFASSNPADS